MEILFDKVVKTRKRHRCDACNRIFDKGTEMRRCVVIYDGINQWYECPTCKKLLSKFSDIFDDGYGVHEMGCVDGHLEKGETPELLLKKLENG